MSQRTAITVNRAREEVERRWNAADHEPRHITGADATVMFADAPGDRGTEIHVSLDKGGNKLVEGVRKLVDSPQLAKVKDDLRHFKQLVETGEIARSDATPEGEHAEAKFKQRPAQPLPADELAEVGS
jgi:uncharacterized membrane protein